MASFNDVLLGLTEGEETTEEQDPNAPLTDGEQSGEGSGTGEGGESGGEEGGEVVPGGDDSGETTPTDGWIRDDRYGWYDDYGDENYSIIDENKNITLNNTQAVLAKESYSQYLPFRMPRYYDKFDLTRGFIQIHWVNSEGLGSRATAINVQYNDDTIRFAWLLGPDVTDASGTISFEIDIVGVNSFGQSYRYISRPSSGINIVKSLGEHEEIEVDQSWVEELINLVSLKIAEAQAVIDETKGYAANAEASAQLAESYAADVDEKVNNAEQVLEEYVDDSVASSISASLDNYYQKDTIDTMFEGLDGLADFGVIYDDDSNKIIFYNKGEVVDEGGVVVDNVRYKKIGEVVVNTLDDLDVTYDRETGKLALINKGVITSEPGVEPATYQEIGSVTIYSDPSAEWVQNFRAAITTEINNAIAAVVGDVNDYENFRTLVEYEEQTDADLAGIHTAIDDLPQTLATDYYTKDATDTLLDAKADKSALQATNNTVSALETTVEGHTGSINSYGTKIETLETNVGTLQDAVAAAQNTTYDVNYVADTGAFSFYTNPVYEGSDETVPTGGEEVKTFIIQGGGGGGGVSSTITLRRVTATPVVSLINNGKTDRTIVQFSYASVDSEGQDVAGEANCVWKLDKRQIATSTCEAGTNSFDVTDYLKEGSQTLSLQVTDPLGSVKSTSWVIKVIEVRIECTLNDQITYPAGRDITLGFTPYGQDVEKTIKYVLKDSNGVQKSAGTYTDLNSGYTRSFTLPGQAHGSYYLELWMEATVNNTELNIPHIYKDILFSDAENAAPLIGVAPQSLEATEYDTVTINYFIVDPEDDTPNVKLQVYDSEGVLISSEDHSLTSNYGVWAYKATEVGTFTLKIVCGETTKNLSLKVTELGIDIKQVTDGLVYDFNPAGHSNSSTDTTATNIWTSSENNVHMTVSDNFDWVNGGYQIDANGDTYFCVKAGTRAYIDYAMFGTAADIKTTGMEFKATYKVTNVSDFNTSVISCVDGTNNIGLRINPHEAYINSSASSLYVPLSEEDIIEFEFNIASSTDSVPMLMSYEDGVPCMPLIYSSADIFNQDTAKPVTIGSDNCDIHIYRMRSYNKSLTNKNILDNFIADGRNAAEIIDRYTRNNIYNESGRLTPESVYNACPELRVIVISSDHFTTGKKDTRSGATIQCMYKGTAADDPETIRLNNWTATNAGVSGQGTSSEAYGASARNVDLRLNMDGTVITLDDGDEVVSKVALTSTSIPNAYFNVKLNVASSENANNALLQKRYDRFLPYASVAKQKDERVKNSMEFYNCVIFIQENDPNLNNHVEFNDTEIHFYGIGNIGDSKKTDKTRANDNKDGKEFCVELMDVDRPLSEFPTGATALQVVAADPFDEKSKFTIDGVEYTSSYGIRYGDDDDAETMAYIKSTWLDFYTFLTRDIDDNDPEDVAAWKAEFQTWFILDDAMYYYLFTLFNTMIDNRAKNTFWHYAKCEDGQYRFSFWDYDNDSSLGINNTGKLTMTYGVEDFDKDDQGNYHFRCANSTFFVRLAKYFATEIATLYNNVQTACWSATDAIDEFDHWQAQFPEELWRLDFERKYLRPYNGTVRDPNASPVTYFFEPATNYLESMANGRKKYQRRQFLRNQEIYMASKFVSTTAQNSRIQLRCSNPSSYVVVPNYTITVTPYMNMYLNIYNGQVQVMHQRAEAGKQYSVLVSDSNGADFVYIYSANRIQSLGDLSAMYLNYCDIGSAEKLKEFIIGNTTSGYQNIALTTLTFGSNTLLETIDMRNASSLTSAFDFSRLAQLKVLHAEGSAISGVTFANGGMLQEAYLPNTITTINAKNLSYLETFSLQGLDNLAYLIVDNCPAINTYALAKDAPLLARVRLTGLDWNADYGIQDTAIFDRLAKMRGFDSSDAIVDTSVLAGSAYVSVIREQKYYDYKQLWNQLDISYSSMINTVTATFINEDGTVLDVQYVDKGSTAVDPTTRAENPIPIPTKESTVDKTFVFAGWSNTFISLLDNITYTAQYTAETRKYTISYVVNGSVKQTVEADYGSTVVYDGETPTYTAEEAAFNYYLFSGWDKSGFVTGDKVINAVFDSCTYTNGYFDGKDISEMRPVEIYALTQAARQISGLNVSDYVEEKDSVSFLMGNDFNYSDVEQVEIISSASDALYKGKQIFDGASTVIDTGIKLFETDRDWVLAVDYKFDLTCPADTNLMYCRFNSNQAGIRLYTMTSGTPRFIYGASGASAAATLGSRDILIIRHVKGERILRLYKGNLPNSTITYEEVSSPSYQINTDATLTFGAAKTSEGYEKYGKGTVYWAKLWFADLGDGACRSLASWTHEQIDVEVTGFRKYYFADGSERRSSLTFMGKNVLDNSMSLSTTTSTSGGWAQFPLNTFLNDRFYNAIPTQWKGLIKRVLVTSTVGGGSSETSTSGCYIYIPSVIEVDSTFNYEPYAYEGEATSWMNTTTSRLRGYKDAEGYTSYYTRSPNVNSTGYMWYVSTEGTTTTFTTPTNSRGILIMFSV